MTTPDPLPSEETPFPPPPAGGEKDRQISRGALYVAMGQGAFVVSGYLIHMLLGRWLEPASFGTFGVIMTILVWVEITVNNGVPVALQKFLPDLEAAEAGAQREAAVLHAAARAQLAVALAVFGAMFVAAPWLATLLRDPGLTGYLRLALVDVLAMAAYAYYRGTLNGWRRFRQLALTIGAYSLTKLAAITLLVLLGLGIQGALLGNVASSLGGLAMGYYWARRRGTRPPQVAGRRRVTGVDVRAMLAFVLPAALFTLLSNLLLGLDLMGVKALMPDADQVGYYAAAVKLAEAPRLVLLAFSFTLLPSLSHAIAAADRARTRRYLQQAMRLLGLVLLPVLALVTASAEELVVLTFSAPYRPAGSLLAILVFTYAAYTVYITLVTVLLAENRLLRALAIPLALLPVAGMAVWAGVTHLGTRGAAYASLAIVSLAAVVVLTYVVRRFRPVDGALALSLARIALAAAAVWGLGRLWPAGGLWLVLAYALGGALYLVLLLLLGEVRRSDLVEVSTWLSLPRRRVERKEL
ncbi:MAG: oligosaccharide flippase family protein [Anaerolineae bacterium]|nr:oligosaccharide flippase family protein [Anaerolineae bacterium]